jgi:hypothetical protein
MLMKNLKDREEQPWREDSVVMYSFLPFFDDEETFKMGEPRRQTIVRLVRWLLESVSVSVPEFVAMTKADDLPEPENNSHP